MSNSIDLPADLLAALRAELLRLAADEEVNAVTEESRVAYWQRRPEAAAGHHEAARVLRADADRLLQVV